MPVAEELTGSVLRSTSMPVDPVSEPIPVSDAALDAQLLQLFFDRVPMGVAVFGTDMRLQRCNKTWVGFYYEHYFGVPAEYTNPGRHLHELIPGNEETLRPLIEGALAGRVVRQAAHRVAIPGMETYWDVVFAPLFSDGRVVGVVDIVTDATDRVRAAQRLEARIATFTSLAAGMTVDQPLETTLREVVHAVRATTASVGASIVACPSGPNNIPVAYVDEAFGPGYAETLAGIWSSVAPAEARAEDWPRIALRRGFRPVAMAAEPFAPLRPFWTAAGAPEWEDVAVVPLESSGRAFGELTVYLPGGAQLPEDDQAYLIALADQAAVAVQNASLLATATATAGTAERQRLARELHDSVSQSLFSMTMHARAAERHLTAVGVTSSDPAAREVTQLRELTAGALAEMRALIFELRPGALEEEGLLAALRKQAAAVAARTQVPVTVDGPTDRLSVPPEVEEHLYRLTLEAVNNALKHASATAITITVTNTINSTVMNAVTDRVARESGPAGEGDDAAPVGVGLRVEVRDDGVGFDTEAAHPGHLGLGTMADRAAAIGARLAVDSAPGAGTLVTVELPHASGFTGS